MSNPLVINTGVNNNVIDVAKHILGDFYCKEINGDKLFFAGTEEQKQDCTSVFVNNERGDQRIETSEDAALKLPQLGCHRIYLGLTTPQPITRTVFTSMIVNRISDINTSNQTFRMRFSLYLNWLPTELEYSEYIELVNKGDREKLLKWRPHWTPVFDFVNATDYITSDNVRWEFKQNYGKFRIRRLNNFFKDISDNSGSQSDGSPADHNDALFTYLSRLKQMYQSLGFGDSGQNGNGNGNADGNINSNSNEPIPTFDISVLDDGNPLFICCRLNCDLTFAQEFDLHHFPFDCQDLSMLMCDRTTERYRVKFLPYLAGNRHRFVSIDSTWSLLNDWMIDSVFLSLDRRKHGRGNKRLAFIELRINLRRKWQSFLWRQFFFEFFFSGIGLVSFAIDKDSDLPSRLILLVTLLLTMVAFSLSLDDKIPNVPYETFLEQYIFINYAFLAYLLVESILSTYYSVDNIKMFKYSIIIFASVQLLFMLYGVLIRFWEKNKIRCGEHERKKYMNHEKGVFGIDYHIANILEHSGKVISKGGLSHVPSLSMDASVSLDNYNYNGHGQDGAGGGGAYIIEDDDYGDGYKDHRHHLPFNQLSFRHVVKSEDKNKKEYEEQLDKSIKEWENTSTHVTNMSHYKSHIRNSVSNMRQYSIVSPKGSPTKANKYDSYQNDD